MACELYANIYCHDIYIKGIKRNYRSTIGNVGYYVGDGSASRGL
jgi:hypothetical protein